MEEGVTMAKLTEKQRRFCEEYLKDGNATQAAIRAGYKKENAFQTGAENLKKPKVLAYKEELMRQAGKDSKSAIADAEEVLAFYTAMMRGEVKSQELVIDGMSPAHLEEVPPSQQTRLKAATELAKRWGLNVNTLNVEQNIPVVITGGDDLVD